MAEGMPKKSLFERMAEQEEQIDKTQGGEEQVTGWTTGCYDTSPAPEANKNDKIKVRMDLVPPDVVEAMAWVLTDGAEKYGDRNWEEGMRWGRLYAALHRHMGAWWMGEGLDPESGRSHLWHALCCISFLTAYELRGVGKDDRPQRFAVRKLNELTDRLVNQDEFQMLMGSHEAQEGC